MRLSRAASKGSGVVVSGRTTLAIPILSATFHSDLGFASFLQMASPVPHGPPCAPFFLTLLLGRERFIHQVRFVDRSDSVGSVNPVARR
jgi:hypothetical protein